MATAIPAIDYEQNAGIVGAAPERTPRKIEPGHGDKTQAFAFSPYNRHNETSRVMTVLAAKVMENEYARIAQRFKHSNQWLTARMVRDIRKSADSHEMIAAQFGISRQHVGQLKLRHTRKEVK